MLRSGWRPQPLVTVISVISVLVVLAVGAAAVAGPVLYQLEEQSSYIEGCYAPCMCPLWLNPTLTGTFLLEMVESGSEFKVYQVSGVDWNFVLGEETITVNGSGVYLLGTEEHQLQLDLQVGSQDPRPFDSGLVPLASDFPDIVISVAANGFYCYDHVFSLHARTEAVVTDSATWGGLKAIYR
jgi:hypothetical protein